MKVEKKVEEKEITMEIEEVETKISEEVRKTKTKEMRAEETTSVF